MAVHRAPARRAVREVPLARHPGRQLPLPAVPSQAFAWDHCHEHGHVRGPLCTSCNNVEGKTAPDSFLQLEGGALHLLQCRGCREQRTLPRRFHLEVVRAHLKRTERHGRCHRQPYVRAAEHTHGVPLPAAVQRMAREGHLDEGRHRLRGDRARGSLRRHSPRRTRTPALPRHARGHGVTGSSRRR
ncbi:endonuclease domain-containing protein [Streptomyces flaveolus]|uniref:endonuclease domain-containing protein n=1 Tax=Streptomyces flaveolus TaxID=67297 RepID=UPI0033D4B4C3